MNFEYVDTQSGLDALCDALGHCDWIAIDTEFQREKTWFPRLSLIQIATSDATWIVDAISLDDITPLLDRLYDRSLTKVLHSGRQDMEIFFHLRDDLPTPVFDTQVAAALLGYSPQIGYADLVRKVLDVEIDKGQTRSDWMRRPLSDAQLRYAAADAYWLARAWIGLRDRLAERGRLEWHDEDISGLVDDGTYRLTPDGSWQRIRGTGKLAGAQLSVLRALAAWRDETAMREDKPRNWLVRDGALLALSRFMPSTAREFERIKDLQPGTIRRHGQTIIELIAQSRDLPPPDAIDVGAPDPAQKALTDQLQAVTADIAAQLGIDATLIATRKQLAGLARGERDLPFLSGWRRPIAGDVLLEAARSG